MKPYRKKKISNFHLLIWYPEERILYPSPIYAEFYHLKTHIYKE